MSFVPDEKAKRMLTILKENSRASFTDIAQDLGLTEGAIRKRMKSLVENNIIEKFTIEAKEFVYPVRAILMVKVGGKSTGKDLIEKIRGIDGVRSAHAVTGGYDLFVDMHASTTNELHEKIGQIKSQKGVSSAVSMTILS